MLYSLLLAFILYLFFGGIIIACEGVYTKMKAHFKTIKEAFTWQ